MNWPDIYPNGELLNSVVLRVISGRGTEEEREFVFQKMNGAVVLAIVLMERAKFEEKFG